VIAFIARYKSIYQQYVKSAKTNSREHQQASMMDRNDLESEYEESAITELYETAHGGLFTLFDYDATDLTNDDSLISEYGYENFALYMKLQKR